MSMKIYINEEILNSPPDEGMTLIDIYDEVGKWANHNGKYLLQCFVDGVEIPRNELASLPADKTERLDFYVGDEINVVLDGLNELDIYIDKIGNTLYGRDSLTERESKDLQEGLVWMESVFHSAEKILRISLSNLKPVGGNKTAKEILETALHSTSKLDSVTTIDNYLDNLRDLKIFVMELLSRASLLTVDLGTIKELIHNYSENMEVLKNEFIKVNENFQSGKDGVGTRLLEHSAGRLHIMLSSLISLSAKMPELNITSMEIEGKNFQEATSRLSTSLEEVARALETNDIVLAGDILEYELPETLDSFVPFLKEVAGKIGKTI